MTVNCAAWIFYAMLLKDYYIYFGNMPGLLLGLFYVQTCYKFSKEAVSRSQQRIGILLFWCQCQLFYFCGSSRPHCNPC